MITYFHCNDFFVLLRVQKIWQIITIAKSEGELLACLFIKFLLIIFNKAYSHCVTGVKKKRQSCIFLYFRKEKKNKLISKAELYINLNNTRAFLFGWICQLCKQLPCIIPNDSQIFIALFIYHIDAIKEVKCYCFKILWSWLDY